MGKKGSFQFDDDDDLDFGDEMFPMDDDAFGDFDSFGGSEEGGKKGFFKNVAKSIKGLGVDIIGEFLPEAVSLKDELSMSISDASGKLTELKEAMADKKIKSSSNKGAFKKDIADMGKDMANDLKKGKLYKSEADAPLNMDFGDDDYGDDDDDDGPSEPEDTSGKLTTKMSSSKKYKPNKLIVETSNANEIKAMEKIQQNAVITNAKIQSRMNTKNMMMTEHNFNAQISVLKNIANNIYNISNFISKEGVTSVKANLEYGAKSLAFMADQNALLKDLITTSKKQIGEYKDENDSMEFSGSNDPFFMGSFSLGNYLSKIGENAKDMFGNSMAGQAYSAYQMQNEMMNGMGMKKQTPAQMVAGMLKQSIPGLLLSGNTKNKLENANTLIGGLGGSFVSRMNRVAENSDNPLLSGLGQLLGIDTYNDKSVAMGIANPKGAVPFDEKSHKTLNTVIPGYLGKITALLGGGEETYFDYISNTFKTVSSKNKQYDLVKSEAMNSNMHFSQGMDTIYKNALTKNDTADAGVDPETLKDAFSKFKENVVDSKMELNRNDLMNKNKKDYQEKIFAGIRGRDEKETRAIRSILTASVDQLANSGVGLQMLNSGIHATSSNVSAATKQFKEDSLLYGGDIAMAETNINEKYDASDFNLKYSKAYNVDKHKIGTKGYLNALQNAAMVRQSEFMERGGLVGSINPDSDVAPGMGGSVNASASQTLTNIYDLLLGGIIVFPAKMTNADNKRLTSLQDNRSELISASKKRKEEEKLLEESRSKDIVKEMLSVKRQSAATNLASFADDSIAGKIRKALGVDRLMSGLSDGIGTVFGKITGQGATGDLNSYSLADNSEVKEILEAREAKNNALANGVKGFGADLYSKAKVKSGGKGLLAGVSRLFTNSVEKSKGFYEDHKDSVSSYLSDAQKSLNEKKLKAKDFTGAQFGKLKAAKDNLVGKMPKGFVEGVSNYTGDLKRNYYGTKGYIAVVGKFSKKRLNELFEIIKANGFEPTNSIDSEVTAYIGSPSSEEKDTIKENNIYKIGGTNTSDSAIVKFLSEDYYNIYQNQMYDDEDVEEDTQTTSKASKRKIKQADMHGSNALVRSRSESPDKVSKPLISISTVKNDNSVRRGAIRKTGGVSIDKGTIASIGKLSSGVNTTNKILSRIEASIKGLKRGGKERVKRVREKRKKSLLSRAFGLVPKAFGAAGKLAKGAFGLVPKAFGVAGELATGAFGLGKKALGFGAKVVKGGLSLPGHLLKGIGKRKREDKQMVKKLKEIKAKIESGEELTEEEKTYWDLNSERLDKPSKTDLIKKGFGFLLTNTRKIFSFVTTKGLSLGKNLMTNGRTYLTRSIGAVMTLIKGKSVDDLSDEEVIAYAAKLTGKPIDELKTIPIEKLRSIVGEDLKRKTPLNKLKGILSFARSKITGISQASRDRLSQLKKEVKIRGEEFFNSLTRDEAIARLSELLNVPKETLQSMTLDEVKAKLREMISGKMKLTGVKNLFGKIGSAFASGKLKSGFGKLKDKFEGNEYLRDKFSNAKEFLGDKFGKTKSFFKSKFDGIARNEDGTIEGTYHDKKNDEARELKEERESSVYEENLKQSALLATIVSILSTGLPAGAQKKITESNKSILKGGVGKLAKFLGGATIGLAAAGVATAVAGAVALGKKTFDKIKLSKTELKNTNFGEKINFAMGGSSGANYDSHGNEIGDRVSDRATRGFGLSKLRLGTVVGVGGINKLAGGFIKLITKVLNNKKIVGKLGKKGVSSIISYLTGKIGKKFLVKAAGKIGALLTKAATPVGWAIIAAQTAADFISGMSKTSRYFKLGKGIKPTLAMRLTSGAVNVLSGLTFGLIPTEMLVNKIYEITAKDSVKDAINKGKDFVDKRAKVLGVDGSRLAEYETMPWNERLFGGTTKAATILGFAKGKDDVDGIAKYKEWRDSKYKPLMEIYENMKDEYGKKVESVLKDEADILNQDKFRSSYLKASSSYVTKNNLGELGVMTSKSFEEEESVEGEGMTSGSAVNTAGSGSTTSGSSSEGSASEGSAASAAASTAVTGASAISPSSSSTTASGSASISGGSSLAGGKLSSSSSEGVKGKKPGFFSRLFKGTLTGAMMLPGIKGAMAAITAFKNKRKESEAELDNLFNQNDTKAIGKIADNIKDKRINGQVSSLSSLNPEFAERMESFLKDPRIAGRGVKLRETMRAPLTQLAYYSKGRADPSVTDMLMKKAGFKQGINFWPKSFQGPGQYTTWTLGSNHFDGTAVDLEPGDIGYDALGSIASEYGINWGGSWKNSDPPHFELDPNWKEGSETKNTSSGVASNKTSTSKLSDSYQADATNYSKGRVGQYKLKSVFHKQQPIGNIPSMNQSSISSSSKSNHTSGTLGMTILESKLGQIYNIAFEGNQLLGELLNEQKRHNKVAEEGFSNIIKGIMMLGKIASSSGSGGFSSNSITNNLFDALAKGV